MSTASEVRARVRAEHATIGRLMDEVRCALDSPVRAPPRWEPAMELCAALERLLDFEDRELLPILSDADAWGDVRVASLDDEHRAQRAMIAALREDIDAGFRTADDLVEEVVWFVGALERDLAEERYLILTGEPLSDGCIVVDQSDG